MVAKVQMWGNSLAVRIPKVFANEVGIRADSDIEMRAEDGLIIVEPIRRQRPSLSDLLAGVTPENIHGEVSTGPGRGREIW